MSKRPNHWKEVESKKKIIQRKTLEKRSFVFGAMFYFDIFSDGQE